MAATYYIYRVGAAMPVRGAGEKLFLDDEPYAGPYDDRKEAERHARQLSSEDVRYVARRARRRRRG